MQSNGPQPQVCHHQIAHMLRNATRDDNTLTFVRFASCLINHKDNAYSFLHKGRQFVGEFSDALEVKFVGWRDSYLEQDCDVFEDVNAVNGFGG